MELGPCPAASPKLIIMIRGCSASKYFRLFGVSKRSVSKLASKEAAVRSTGTQVGYKNEI